MNDHPHHRSARTRHLLLSAAALCVFSLFVASSHAQTNDWVAEGSGNWDVADNWSLGLPNSSQSEVRIANPGSKAVAIQPTTPDSAPQTMTVQNLRIRGVAPDTNVLLLNFFGTLKPLRVLNDFTIETNGRALMLSSSLNVSNVLTIRGTFDQDGGALVFTNSPSATMQIDGGRFNTTNGLVTGANLLLGGTNDSYLIQDGGVISVSNLTLGNTATYPFASNATFQLQNGWLVVDSQEIIGGTDLGTLIQNNGTNSTPNLLVGNGVYTRNGGALFAGQMVIDAPLVAIFAPPSAVVNHLAGSATITNLLRLVGESSRFSPRAAMFNMSGGSLSTPLIQLQTAAEFHQTGGVVTLSEELSVNDFGSRVSSDYFLSGGTLLTPRTTLLSSYPNADGFVQSGGSHVVSDTLSLNGSAMYQFRGGTVSAPNMVLSGNFSYPPAQFFVLGAPAFTVTNQNITMQGGAIVMEDSRQQFGRLTLSGDSGVNLAGASAILRFADSHTNSWLGSMPGGSPMLTVYNWNGSTNGGGADQLVFGSSSSALTTSQLRQIRFIDPAGFPPGTCPARILSTGEVVPIPAPMLSFQFTGTTLQISWSGNFVLQSSANVAGPYTDVANAANPFSVDVTQSPMQFFRLRN